MYNHVLRPSIPAGVTFLLIISNASPVAAGLRDEAASYRTQGYEAQRRGDKLTAMSFYQKAAQLDPSYQTPHNDIGILYEEEGRLEDAKRSYEHALSLDPDYLEAHANLAMLSERLGEREQAVYHWMRRYQLGDSADVWTARAEERLVALGVLKDYPGLRGKLYTRQRLIDQELATHAQSREEFRAVTEKHGDWP